MNLSYKNRTRFSYSIEGNRFRVKLERGVVNWNIAREHFEKVYPLVPIYGPSAFKVLIDNDNSYIWAVLHDDRIRQGDY